MKNRSGHSSAPSPSRRNLPKGDASRLHILKSSLNVFGQYGYDGATTRVLANAAGVQLGAFQYYFGGKKGLYLAVADFVAELISAELADTLASAAAVLDKRDAGQADLYHALMDILETFALRVMAKDDSRMIARFIVREQMDATEAFDHLYQGSMKQLLSACQRLMGRILAKPESSNEIKIRTIAIIGQITIFETSRAMVIRNLNWKTIRKTEIDQIRSVIHRQTAALLGLTELS